MFLRKLPVLGFAIAALAVAVAFAQTHVQPKKGNTQVYANEVREAYESSIATVGPDDVLSVIEVKKNHYKVKTATGDVGFVPKSELTKASAAKVSKSIAFEAANIESHWDNPHLTVIMDMGEADVDPVTLNRSFKEALKENTDKESMERLAR